MGEGGSVAVVLEVTSEQHLVVDGMQLVADLEMDTGHHTAVDGTLIVAGLEVAAVNHAVVEPPTLLHSILTTLFYGTSPFISLSDNTDCY